MIERVVREKSTSGGWYNWATFKYDGRSQLLDEKYTYSSDGSSTTLVYQATNAYDLAGNVTYRVLKRLESSTLIAYAFTSLSYSRGYQLLSFIVTDDQGPNTWTYQGSYDTRGNLLSYDVDPTTPTPPFVFPSFTYDNFNNVATYTVPGTTWYLWRDALGRVFRKANTDGVAPTNATHYYYAFNALAQEYDMSITAVNDDIEFDYLRGFNGRVLRQRDIDEEQDRQPIRDILGSAINVCNADEAEMSQNTSGYTFDAWGESFAAGDADGQPAETNHIRYHGAFTEEFVSPGDTDGVYRMGARHYSTVLGRFFQREPMTLIGPPNPTCPLSANPYIYSHNSPTTTTDISGLQTMGMSSTYSEGTLYPPENHDPQPFVPMPDPDPGFEGPEDFPGKPGMMALQSPWGICPWWDRRFPVMPLPDICMGLNAPGFWAIPELPQPGTSIWDNLASAIGAAERALAGAAGGRPYGPGRQLVNVGGGSSGGGGGGGSTGGTITTYDTGHAMMTYQGSNTYSQSDFNQDQASYNRTRNAELSALGTPEERLARAIAGEASAKEEARKANAAVWWGVTKDIVKAVVIGVSVGILATEACMWLASRGVWLGARTLFASGFARGWISIRGLAVYRVWGGTSRELGKYWTTINPATYSGNLRKELGIGAWNTMVNISRGKIYDLNMAILRPAASGGISGGGGGIEIYVYNFLRYIRNVSTKFW